MKIVKYFYGNPLFVETMTSLTDKSGKYVNDICYVTHRKPMPRTTICGIYDSETNTLKIGIARCSSKDIFIKKIGRELAYNRAESNPIITMPLLKGEVLSHVFFNQARLLDQRYSSANFIKF